MVPAACCRSLKDASRTVMCVASPPGVPFSPLLGSRPRTCKEHITMTGASLSKLFRVLLFVTAALWYSLSVQKAEAGMMYALGCTGQYNNYCNYSDIGGYTCGLVMIYGGQGCCSGSPWSGICEGNDMCINCQG